MNKKLIKQSILKALKSLWRSVPMLLGTIFLLGVFSTLVPKSFYIKFFTGNFFLDPIIGSLIGSISAGNPITSYIFGGEFLKQGINLLVVTAFLVSWVTVGLIQLPAESAILGKKFALIRNLSSFILAIIVAIITILILKVY